MEQQMRLAKQWVELQKIVFDGMVNNMIAFWDQTEQALGPLVDQAGWAPKESKGIFREWIGRNRKGCKTFKQAANQGFNLLEGIFAGQSKPQQHKSD